jgi:XTP/dITP diphosphohydrolase
MENSQREFVLATGNQGKVKELSDVLAPFDVRLRPQSDFDVSSVAETGTTFVENAIIKARHGAKETGLPCMADDSGLAVDALGGKPGIYSARYSCEDATDRSNIDKLLMELDGTPKEKRSAQFHCCLVFMRHELDPTPIISHGIWRGEILTELQGEGGFGYDPVFWLSDLTCTAAQLTKAQKQAISHRGLAVKGLISQMQASGILS